MAEYLTTTEELASVADSIRAKGGTSDPLVYPQGFVDAVEAIQTGGGESSPEAEQYLQLIELNRKFNSADGSIDLKSDKVSFIGHGIFEWDSRIRSVDFPNCIGDPSDGAIGQQCFHKCGYLERVNLPKVRFFNWNGFDGTALSKIDFPACERISASVFDSCKKLVTAIFRGSSVIRLDNANSFSGTPIASGAGYIYVPKSLVEQYKAATNWVTYAAQIRAIEDFPEITGG